MKKHAGDAGREALELVEEGVHLLCGGGVQLLASYYVGSLPFILGLLYFWADMSRSAFAEWHSGEAAFGLAVLFIWMKAWQAIFAQGLRRRIQGGARSPWTVRRAVRLLKRQASIQPLGLFLLPVALLVTVPFGWGYAFYQNALVAGDEEDDIGSIYRQSLRQASLWPSQNHKMLAVLFLFGIFIFINLGGALILIPYLLKMLLGLDTVFTRTGIHVLNTTFLTTVGGLTYLSIDPLVKTVYVLRCFYGDSLVTGEDLRVRLRAWVQPARLGTALILLCVVGAGEVYGAQSAVTTGAQTGAVAESRVGPAELDRSITEVLGRREYRWRLPRGFSDPQSRELPSFIEGLVHAVRRAFKAVVSGVIRVLKWLKDLLPDGFTKHGDSKRPVLGWRKTARLLMLALTVVLAWVVGMFLSHLWKRRRRGMVEATAAAAPVIPDLTDENMTADRLPSAEWGTLAKELMDEGELRLGLRALYLAVLAMLAERGLIAIARHKSDREYERDLRRRIHVQPVLLQAFAQNLTLFESAWYGSRKLTPQDLRAFTDNFERMKVCA